MGTDFHQILFLEGSYGLACQIEHERKQDGGDQRKRGDLYRGLISIIFILSVCLIYPDVYNFCVSDEERGCDK